MFAKAILLALGVAVTTATFAAPENLRACNFTEASNTFLPNPVLVTALGQFGLTLDDDSIQAKRVLRGMQHYPKVKPKNFYIDHKVVEPNDWTYRCINDGVGTINYEDDKQFPRSYQYCFMTAKGTLNDAEQFIEDHLGLSRSRWLLNSKNGDKPESLWGRFLRNTTKGAEIRPVESGIFSFRNSKRYFTGLISVAVQKEKTAVTLNFWDSTDFVEKQIACENESK